MEAVQQAEDHQAYKCRKESKSCHCCKTQRGVPCCSFSFLTSLVHDKAVKLHAQFGGHSIDYYLKDIVQETAATPSHKVSGWNVFLHQEAKCLNEGISLPIALKLLN